MMLANKNVSSFYTMPKLDATDKLNTTAEYLMKHGGTINPEVMMRKGIYDKLAAQVILQRFVDFYNSDEDILK